MKILMNMTKNLLSKTISQETTKTTQPRINQQIKKIIMLSIIRRAMKLTVSMIMKTKILNHLLKIYILTFKCNNSKKWWISRLIKFKMIKVQLWVKKYKMKESKSTMTVGIANIPELSIFKKIYKTKNKTRVKSITKRTTLRIQSLKLKYQNKCCKMAQ